MNRAICTTLIAAIACAAFLGTTPSSAAIACTATGKIPVVNGQGHLNTHFAVNCTNGQSWTVFGTVQAFVSGSWQRAGNTSEITVNGSGDQTVTAEVESGQWSCAPGRLYRSHAVLQNGNTDNSSAITLC